MKLLGDDLHKLNSLQYLRAFCAIVVVLYHVEGGVNSYWKFADRINWFTWGNLGVPMFFCLSGFVISYSCYLRPKKPFPFLFSRFARIYPTYLLIAVLFVGSILVLPAGTFNSAPTLTFGQLVRTLLFDYGRIGGYVYTGWTLFYEMAFYLFFSVISF
jgi:exopolysaccharide production protein ExoZ